MSTNTLDFLPLEEALREVRAAGFQEVELNGCRHYYDGWDARAAARMRAALDAAELIVRAVHAPRRALRLAVADEAVRRAAIDAATASFVQTRNLGATIVVVHPNGVVGSDDPAEQREIRRRTRADLATLAERAAVAGVRMAVENMPFNEQRRVGATMADLLDVIDGLGGHVGVCLDAGHSNAGGGDPSADARLAGKKLFAVHLQDGDGSRDQHRVPGEGSTDWEAFVATLDALGYKGPRSFEVESARNRELAPIMAALGALRARWEGGDDGRGPAGARADDTER
jgi:sugar phosphate isomerase/epimerase